MNIPYGEYLLQVNPPDGQLVEKQVSIHQPKEKFEILISGFEQYDLSGIVIDEDTKQPIAGYDLLLDALGYQTKSGPDGRFAFNNLPPYIYDICTPIPENGIVEYMLASSDLNYYMPAIPLAKVTVPSDKQDNVEIRLHKAVNTKLSGMVIDTQRKPLQGAKITVAKIDPNNSLAGENLGTIPKSVETNQNGGFAFYLPNTNTTKGESINYEINAAVGHNMPGGWSANSDNSYTIGYPSFIPETVGSINAKGKAGEDINNLVITIAGKMEKSIHGRLIAEEENFEPVYMTAKQNSIYKTVDKKPDGTFTIANMVTGDFSLSISPNIDTIIETTFEILTERKYVHEQLKLTIPENEKEMYIDIHLRRNLTLTGTIGYADGSPLRFSSIQVSKENDKFYIGYAKTNHKGFFKIDGLVADGYYQFNFFDPENKQKLFTSDWISPSVGEVHYVIK